MSIDTISQSRSDAITTFSQCLHLQEEPQSKSTQKSKMASLMVRLCQRHTTDSVSNHNSPSSPSHSQPCGLIPDCCPREDSCCQQSERALRSHWGIWMRVTRSRPSPRRTTSCPSVTWPTPPSLPGISQPPTTTHSSLIWCAGDCGYRVSVRPHQAYLTSTQQGRPFPSSCSRKKGKKRMARSCLAALTL